LTDFKALDVLDVYKSGIGLAIIERTDNNLAEQVAALQQRPGFRYRDLRGAANAMFQDDVDSEHAYTSDQFDVTESNCGIQ
jgi:hypothetical protein